MNNFCFLQTIIFSNERKMKVFQPVLNLNNLALVCLHFFCVSLLQTLYQISLQEEILRKTNSGIMVGNNHQVNISASSDYYTEHKSETQK